MAALDVFMDTAGFLALWDAADEHHGRALRLQSELVRKGRRFLTTDYVIDETVTLLLMRHSHAAAADFLQTVTTSESLQLHWVTADRFHAAAAFFAQVKPNATIVKVRWNTFGVTTTALKREQEKRAARRKKTLIKASIAVAVVAVVLLIAVVALGGKKSKPTAKASGAPPMTAS